VEKSLDDFTGLMKELSGLLTEVKLDQSVVYNEDVHHNLLALGYEYDGRDEFGEEYSHPDNDDWFGVNSKGHINPLDACEYTEGSVRGRKILAEQGPWAFMNIHKED
jgi:hypothetical protein